MWVPRATVTALLPWCGQLAWDHGHTIPTEAEGREREGPDSVEALFKSSFRFLRPTVMPVSVT